tara:strand:- start:7997 stop:9502 length:1506 start_codon:yes stop_codon:yes gene_type:complete
MKMIMPSHAKNVKFYTEQLPLYARFQVEGYLAGMFNPTVQLPSGGYIVIGITEALVAIDVNSGRATKEGSIEQTATKTNLEAADEVARQLRLRDLAGLIVIDFIDMDERRNNIAVEKRMKDKLKTDRARIQVGRISGFGLMEMSRQRLRPGMLEATTQMCSHCHGTGLLRSDDNVALSILRALEEEGVRGRSKEVLVRAPISIANFLMNGKREHIGDIEARYGMSVRIECDTTLVSPDFAIEKFKTATRVVPDAAPIVTSSILMDDDDDDIVDETPDEEETAPQVDNAVAAESADDEERPKKKRRRRRRRRGGAGNGDGNGDGQQAEGADDSDADATVVDAAPEGAEEAPVEKPKRTRSRSRKKVEEPVEAAPEDEVVAAPEADEGPVEAEKPKKRTRSRKKVEPAVEVDVAAIADDAVVLEKPKPKRKSRAKPKAEAVAAEAAGVVDAVILETAPETKSAEPALAPIVVEKADEPVAAPAAVEPENSDKPKRKGWWSLGR